tara:strand:+ start:411 stop:2177 length:1767 start_codon:yes stop_codon:yes gene_type:complete
MNLKNKIKKILKEQQESIPQIVDPFNYLVPYAFDNSYTGPNLTVESSIGNPWILGQGNATNANRLGAMADCNAPTAIHIGILLGNTLSQTAGYAGEEGSVFYMILEYLWNSGDFNQEFRNIIYESYNIGYGSALVNPNFNISPSEYWEELGSIGLCYNVANGTSYLYQRSKKLQFNVEGELLEYTVSNINEILDAILDANPNFDINTIVTFDDLVQALASFNVICPTGGCSGKCYCCCRNNGCNESDFDNQTEDDGYTLGCTDPEALNYDPNANFDSLEDICEYAEGCTNPNALNYNPDAVINDGSCEFEGFICPPDDSLAAEGCVNIPAEPGTMFPLEMGPDGNVISETLAYASKEECDNAENCIRKEGGEKILCWKCTDNYPYQPTTISIVVESSPLFEQDEKGRIVRKKKPDKNTEKDKIKGCPDGYQIAPEPFWTWDGGPYDTMQGGVNNPCSGPDKPDRDPPMGPPIDDTTMTGGPFFCPADVGNFPWPGCCIQAGIDYSNILTQYPEAPNWLQTYFDSPVGEVYSSNVECNANSGCGRNMLPNGTGNCAGADIPGPSDNGLIITESLIKRFQKIAGIKPEKK